MLDGLNEAQRRAVESDSKTILCLAGAGTGKTRTLTHRIAYLSDNRVSCNNMLALTFTRLAGKEMKERVIDLIGDQEGKKLFCNTFHAFCVKVLKEYGYLLGYDNEFTIYDQDDRKSIIKAIIGELGYKNCTKEKHIISILEGSSEADCGEEEDVIKEYYWRLKRNNAIDLDMLLTETLKLLTEFVEVKLEYQRQYKYMFVDEFQDTNDVQMNIIKILSLDNLFVVGDDFQSIYGWRQAKPEYIINFKKYYPDCEIIKLEDNYRSTEPIIKAANKVIKNNVNQTEKKLIAHKEGTDIEKIEAEDAEHEAISIAARILEVNGYFKDIAVLARTNKQLEVFKEIFDKYEIPCEVVNNKGDIFKKHDIKLLFKMIEAAINPKDDITLKKIVNFPKTRISSIELEKLELSSLDNNVYLADALEKNLETAKLMRDLYFLVNDKESYEAADVFKDVVEITQLFNVYSSESRSNKIQDLYDAKNYIQTWMKRQSSIGEDTSIFALLKWMVLKDIQEKLIEEKNTVKLMTVHASKGLEFPYVFIAGLNQNTFPSQKGDLEEERRLFYVAITRAKDKLFLTRASTGTLWGNKAIEMLESQFIKEALN